MSGSPRFLESHCQGKQGFQDFFSEMLISLSSRNTEAQKGTVVCLTFQRVQTQNLEHGGFR